MDINFIQETIDSLRTLTQQNGALTRQNSQLINEVAKESTINTKVEEIKQVVENIDLSSLENKMEEGVNNLSNKLDNIKLPEIDTSNIASKDLERFFGVKPIEGYEFMTPEEVCSELEEIMTYMDLVLTPEQAKEITNNTLNKE